MAYQQTLTASETPLDGASLLAAMLQRKRNALSEGIMLPDSFIARVEEFAKRNSLANVHPDCKEEGACPRCLKGFMLSEASSQGLTEEAKEIIHDMLPTEAGHHGYYLDNEELKEVLSQ